MFGKSFKVSAISTVSFAYEMLLICLYQFRHRLVLLNMHSDALSDICLNVIAFKGPLGFNKDFPH